MHGDFKPRMHAQPLHSPIHQCCHRPICKPQRGCNFPITQAQCNKPDSLLHAPRQQPFVPVLASKRAPAHPSIRTNRRQWRTPTNCFRRDHLRFLRFFPPPGVIVRPPFLSFRTRTCDTPRIFAGFIFLRYRESAAEIRLGALFSTLLRRRFRFICRSLHPVRRSRRRKIQVSCQWCGKSESGTVF